MNTYRYKVVNEAGKTITGRITAQNRQDAISQLKENGRVLLSLSQVRSDMTFLESKRRINEKELALVCRQLSIILKAGLPLVKTLELASEQTQDKTLKNLLSEVAEDVMSGHRLSDSFSKRSAALPAIFTETVRSGEESGRLEDSFARLATYFTKQSKMRGKVASAMAYPILVMAIAVAVIVVIMVYAIPGFTETFEGMGIDLPLATRILIGLSDFFVNYGLALLLVLLLIIAALLFYRKTAKGRKNLAALAFQIPILGKVNLMNAAAQFANTMSTMAASGIPVIRSLDITGHSLSNYHAGCAVLRTVEGVEAGYRLGFCLKKEGIFPSLLVEMTTIGEESGSLEQTLSVIGEYYDNEVEQITSKAISLLEPIIICVLAVFVVLVLLAVYLPMFSMYGSI